MSASALLSQADVAELEKVERYQEGWVGFQAVDKQTHRGSSPSKEASKGEHSTGLKIAKGIKE